LAWVEAEFPPDPDVARRPVWLHFDSRFAHMYAQIVERTPGVIARVLDALITRREFRSARFGMMGVSTTGIATLAAACREPRMESAVAFVATGAVSAWLETWKPNGLWKGRPDEPFWPETLAILEQHDPVRHAAGLKGKRVLLVSGALDNVVDPAAQRVFFEAAREHLAPERLEDLRYVVYEGFAHNLPADAIELEAGPWFRKTLALAGQPRSKPGVSRST
jgi:pimeloyl-ACP methyl ester carboxylesterase